MHLLALPDDILDAFAAHLLRPHRDSRGCLSILDALPAIRPYATFHPRLLGSLKHVHLDLDRLAAASSLFFPHSVARHVRALSLAGSSGPLPLVCGIERLAVNQLDDGVSDASWERFFRCNSTTLRALELSATTCVSAWKSGTLGYISNLVVLSIENCPNISLDTVAGLIASNAQTLRSVTVAIDTYGYYSPAQCIAAHCRDLVALQLGRNEQCVHSIIAAISASRTTLSSLTLLARRSDGTAILPLDTVHELRLLALESLDIGGGVIPLDVALLQGRKLYLSPADTNNNNNSGAMDVEIDINIDIKAYVRSKIAHLDVFNLPVAKHPWLFTPHLRTLKVCAVSEVDLHSIARNTGNLTHITLQDLPNISIGGIHALLRQNRRVEHFAIIGPKCRRLSNVAIINALATHANARLRTAIFPRWSIARTPKTAPKCLTQAIAAFRTTAPMAVIRAE